jgi:Arc/MetJ-type ribon-helix-helix transcriptional regulator
MLVNRCNILGSLGGRNRKRAISKWNAYYVLPPELERLVKEELATGVYATEDEVLLEAMRALQDRDEAIAGIQKGLADLESGRVRPLNAVDID